MDILLEKWPFRAREYLIYMQNIRLAASSCQNNGWLVYDEQYRLKKKFVFLLLLEGSLTRNFGFYA
jgi:hypothetical protein